MTRPPAHVVLAYRLLGWRVGPAWREWVTSDITRPGWLLRQGLPVLTALFALGAIVTAALDATTERLFALLVVLAGFGAFMRRSLQARALRQQGLDATGNVVADWFEDPAARRTRNVVGAVSTVVLVVGGLVILALRSR